MRTPDQRIIAELMVLVGSAAYFLVHLRSPLSGATTLVLVALTIGMSAVLGFCFARVLFPPAGSTQTVQKAMVVVVSAGVLLIATQISSSDGLILGTGLLAVLLAVAIGAELRNVRSGGVIFREAGY